MIADLGWKCDCEGRKEGQVHHRGCPRVSEAFANAIIERTGRWTLYGDDGRTGVEDAMGPIENSQAFHAPSVEEALSLKWRRQPA